MRLPRWREQTTNYTSWLSKQQQNQTYFHRVHHHQYHRLFLSTSQDNNIIMSERNDLLVISKQLAILNHQDDEAAANKTDIELLRSIVSRLSPPEKSVTKPSTLLAQDPSNIVRAGSSGRSSDVLAHNTLPDSLAFPANHRAGSKLVEATDQWNGLRKFNDLLKQDHACRRQMLLNRLDCTVESFKWKGSMKQNNNKEVAGGDSKEPSLNDMIHDKYEKARIGLREEPQVTMSHLLAIRETECDKLLNSVVSTRNFDCLVLYKNNHHKQSGGGLVNLKQIIIPDVPDRGGRPCEARAPTKEGFYQQNRARGRGRGRR